MIKIKIDEVFATPLTEEEKLKQETDQRKQEIYTRFEQIDKEKIRPISAIQTAQTLGQEPSQFDIDKLISLENEISSLREELNVI